MSGIIFFKTKNLKAITEFYKLTIGMETWLNQQDIEILRHGNLLLGFHQQEEYDGDCLITFFYETKEEVDSMFKKFSTSVNEPKMNNTYKIYHFFSKDPEGRKLEFQHFLHPVPDV